MGRSWVRGGYVEFHHLYTVSSVITYPRSSTTFLYVIYYNCSFNYVYIDMLFNGYTLYHTIIMIIHSFMEIYVRDVYISLYNYDYIPNIHIEYDIFPYLYHKAYVSLL